jgi:oligosaccharide repeat unit polymerase
MAVFWLVCSIIGLSLASFSVSRNRALNKKGYTLTLTKNKSKIGVVILLIMANVIALLIINKAFFLGQHGPFDSFFMNIRWNVSYSEEKGYGLFLGYAKPFLLILSLREYLLFVSINKRRLTDNLRLFFGFLPGIIVVFSSMGRGHVVLLVVAMLFIYIIMSGRLKVKSFVIAAVISFMVFVFIGAMLGKVHSDPGRSNLISSGAVSLTRYVTTPLVAWSQLFEKGSSLSGGYHTFRFVYAVASKSGIISIAPMKTIRPHINVDGIRTNLYTFLEPYYKDFGVIGIIAFPLIIGLIVGRINYYIRKPEYDAKWLVLYGLSILPLISIFGGETFFLNLSQWIQWFFWACILCHGWRLKTCIPQT